MGEGGQKTIKWLLFAFNLLFWVSGIGLIIAGALAQTIYRPYFSFLNDTYTGAPVLLIVVGAAIAILAFFGCCGAAKENYCMLVTFAVLLGIIFVVELAGGIAAYVEKGRVGDYLTGKMERQLLAYNISNPETTGAWNTIQELNHCCGIRLWQDWSNSSFGEVPSSCCNTSLTFNGTCDRNSTTLNFLCSPLSSASGSSPCPIYNVGCGKKIQHKLEHNIGIIGGVGVGVAFIQVIGMCFACYLARRIRRGYSYN